jgi:cytochrome P450
LSSAVEEALRVSPPARGFVRTVREDVVLRDTQITAGQRVYLLYDAANRDPEVFENPHTFDVARHQERMHVSFGYGTHTCLGAALVRMEVDLFMTRLLARYPQFSLSAPPVRQRHVQLNGWQALPVTFGP